ncbi:adhesion G-protein coupled receptor G7-like [Arapaima gigas]
MFVFFLSLTEALQKFSVQSTSDTLMVQPNLAVQSASVSEANSRGVQFSLIDPKSFMASRIHFNPNASQLTTNSSGAVQIFIQFPSGQSHKTTNTSVGFVLYQNDKLFRSKVFISELHTNRIVISGQLSGKIIPNHVEISFKPEKVLNASLRNFACVFWNYTLRDWSSYGCSGKKNSLGHLQCQCNHTTNFVVLMSFRMNYAYVDVLNTITIVGCCISIIGLSLTIIYQIMTRKSRKTKPTLLLVSICMSLLMFYVLFIFGITNKESTEENSKNSNEIPTSDLDIPQDSCCCTVFTVFLQYFLLATFTWTTIYSIQLFLLLKCTFNQLHRYFTAIVTVTGWGFPAIVVAITLGATYRVDNPLGYRQEEFCWLAALDREKMFDIRKPMLWGFLFPVALMLSFNTGILVYFTVTQCRTNPDLKSTQKTPILKKFLSSLSLAVVLSITWVIGYLHLVEENYVLAIIFCLLTTTQGFQIFIFFTVRTSAFRKHVRNILHSVFTLIPMHHQKYNLQLHRKTRPKATYKNVDSNISSTA